MSSIDLKRPVLTLSQFTDSSTYVKVLTKLQIIQPIEVNINCIDVEKYSNFDAIVKRGYFYCLFVLLYNKHLTKITFPKYFE